MSQIRPWWLIVYKSLHSLPSEQNFIHCLLGSRPPKPRPHRGNFACKGLPTPRLASYGLRENLTDDPLCWLGINERGGVLAHDKRQSGYTVYEVRANDPPVRREREGRHSGRDAYALRLKADRTLRA